MLTVWKFPELRGPHNREGDFCRPRCFHIFKSQRMAWRKYALPIVHVRVEALLLCPSGRVH